MNRRTFARPVGLPVFGHDVLRIVEVETHVVGDRRQLRFVPADIRDEGEDRAHGLLTDQIENRPLLDRFGIVEAARKVERVDLSLHRDAVVKTVVDHREAAAVHVERVRGNARGVPVEGVAVRNALREVEHGLVRNREGRTRVELQGVGREVAGTRTRLVVCKSKGRAGRNEEFARTVRKERRQFAVHRFAVGTDRHRAVANADHAREVVRHAREVERTARRRVVEHQDAVALNLRKVGARSLPGEVVLGNALRVERHRVGGKVFGRAVEVDEAAVLEVVDRRPRFEREAPAGVVERDKRAVSGFDRLFKDVRVTRAVLEEEFGLAVSSRIELDPDVAVRGLADFERAARDDEVVRTRLHATVDRAARGERLVGVKKSARTLLHDELPVGVRLLEGDGAGAFEHLHGAVGRLAVDEQVEGRIFALHAGRTGEFERPREVDLFRAGVDADARRIVLFGKRVVDRADLRVVLHERGLVFRVRDAAHGHKRKVALEARAFEELRRLTRLIVKGQDVRRVDLRAGVVGVDFERHLAERDVALGLQIARSLFVFARRVGAEVDRAAREADRLEGVFADGRDLARRHHERCTRGLRGLRDREVADRRVDAILRTGFLFHPQRAGEAIFFRVGRTVLKHDRPRTRNEREVGNRVFVPGVVFVPGGERQGARFADVNRTVVVRGHVGETLHLELRVVAHGKNGIFVPVEVRILIELAAARSDERERKTMDRIDVPDLDDARPHRLQRLQVLRVFAVLTARQMEFGFGAGAADDREGGRARLPGADPAERARVGLQRPGLDENRAAQVVFLVREMERACALLREVARPRHGEGETLRFARSNVERKGFPAEKFDARKRVGDIEAVVLKGRAVRPCTFRGRRSGVGRIDAVGAEIAFDNTRAARSTVNLDGDAAQIGGGLPGGDHLDRALDVFGCVEDRFARGAARNGETRDGRLIKFDHAVTVHGEVVDRDRGIIRTELAEIEPREVENAFGLVDPRVRPAETLERDRFVAREDDRAARPDGEAHVRCVILLERVVEAEGRTRHADPALVIGVRFEVARERHLPLAHEFDHVFGR